MEDYHYRIVRLLRDHLCGRTDRKEAEELKEWMKSTPECRELYASFKTEEWEKRHIFFQEVQVKPAFREFERRIGHRRPTFIRMFYRCAALLIVALGVSLWVWKSEAFRSPALSKAPIAIAPGSYQAMLTLADGENVPLNETTEKKLPASGPVTIRNTGKEIIYADTAVAAATPVYNRLTTPRGGEYRLTLSDGSRIYLNAATELKYPVVFDRYRREVYLSGEAYFEVTTDSMRPFYVVTDAARIRVYGTTFNINTHLQGKMQTVLVEGEIGITGKTQRQEYRMRPSELSEFTREGTLITLRQVDIEPYIAWKSGKFLFENKRLEEILDNLAIWYDVEIFYQQPELKEQRFTGNMRRYEQIEVILDAIHRITGVNFGVQGKTITVSE